MAVFFLGNAMYADPTERTRDYGLLLLRVGMGAMFMYHGVPKLLDGPERWVRIGSALRHFGVDFAPAFWGLLAGLSETLGGLFLVLGVFFRPSCAFLLATMVVAAGKHLVEGDGFARASHAIEAGVLFASLIWIGAGKLTLIHWLRGRTGQKF